MARLLSDSRPPRGRPGRQGGALLALLMLAGLASCAPGAARRGEGLRLVPATAQDLLVLARQPGATATLINVWASWCAPCREEFPDLLRLAREERRRGLRVLLVSADFDSAAARAFLAEQGVGGPAYYKVGDDMGFIGTLSPRWSGALPATFVYDARGRLAGFWEGRTDHARFARAVHDAMGRGTDPGTKEEHR